MQFSSIENRLAMEDGEGGWRWMMAMDDGDRGWRSRMAIEDDDE